MSGIEYWVIDLETSGLSPIYHEVTEVSIIRCKDRVQLTQFVKCEYPERANVDALMVTNKTLADLLKGDDKEVVVDKIDHFLNGDGLTPAHRCFVAHNWTFDKKFLHALYEKVGKKCPVDLWMCTMAMTRQYAKKLGMVKPKVNLHASCDLVGVKKLSAAHASKVDSRNTYLLWKNLIEDKKIDYLQFIKTASHDYIDPVTALAALDDDGQGLDPTLLESD
jgi:DNA polymerase III subunit alpha, Gram-positive type